MSHLDYSNAIVLQKGRYDSASDCLKKLHWLPIRYRINFKVLCIEYMSLNGIAPAYLSNLLVETPILRDGLRSSNSYKRLIIPKTKSKTFAPRAFSIYGPELWNNLSNKIRRASSLENFKTLLKAYFYKLVFSC